MTLQSILITGANRGLGLEMVRQYMGEDQTYIIATCRQPDQAHDLNKLAEQFSDRLTVIPLDVTDDAAIGAAVERVEQVTDALDVLINNAGTFHERRNQSFDNIHRDLMLDTLNINTVSPIVVTRAFRPLLRKANAPRVVNVSSQLGSISRKIGGGQYAYATSKAALNMATRVMAGDLRSDGIVSIALHPGWVQTDMGGPGASLTPEKAVTGIRDVIAGLTQDDNGSFLNWDGTTQPW